MSSSTRLPPDRLKNISEGVALRILSAETLSAERLARIGRQLTPRLAAPPPPRRALYKVHVLTALLLGGTGVVYWGSARQPDAVAQPTAVAPLRQPASSTAPVPESLMAKPAATPLVMPARRRPAEVATPAVTTPSVTASDRTTVAEPSAPPPSDVALRPGTLAEQIELLRQAQAASRSGAHADALVTLTRLAAAHPDSALAPEIDLTRWDVLRSLERSNEARELGRELARDARQVGHRARIYTWLIEEALLRHDCASVVALTAEAQHVKVAVPVDLQRCTP